MHPLLRGRKRNLFKMIYGAFSSKTIHCQKEKRNWYLQGFSHFNYEFFVFDDRGISGDDFPSAIPVSSWVSPGFVAAELRPVLGQTCFSCGLDMTRLASSMARRLTSSFENLSTIFDQIPVRGRHIQSAN